MIKKKSATSRPVLVLNKGWTPVSITPVKKAISKTSIGLASILDPETYILYSFEEWMNLTVSEGEDFIQSCKKKIKIPEIIILSDYERLPQRDVKLTRRNLLIRDNYTCQYSGKRINLETATIDHIIPRSRGGGSTWENLVMCCLDVNAKKANRTPEEAGLKLIKKPEAPKWNPIFSRFARLAFSNIPQSWIKFIKVNENLLGEVNEE